MPLEEGACGVGGVLGDAEEEVVEEGVRARVASASGQRLSMAASILSLNRRDGGEGGVITWERGYESL